MFPGNEKRINKKICELPENRSIQKIGAPQNRGSQKIGVA
jgi:hypothetical protein